MGALVELRDKDAVYRYKAEKDEEWNRRLLK